MRYEIIVCSSIDKLQVFVNKSIGAGWKPQGGVAIAVDPDRDDSNGRLIPGAITYAQAMILENSI